MKKISLALSLVFVFVFAFLFVNVSSVNAATVAQSRGCFTGAFFNPTTGERCAKTVSGPTTTSTSPACYVFNRNLTIGSGGEDVVYLQKLLETKGFLIMPAGRPMGYFGPITKAALAAYQASVGISEGAGYFGPITRAYVNSQCESTPPNPRGIQVEVLSTTATLEENSDSTTADDAGIFVINFSVTAPDDEGVYMNLSTLRGTAISSSAASYRIETSTGAEVFTGQAAASLTRTFGGDEVGDYLKIGEGETARLKLEVVFDPAYSDFYKLQLYRLNYSHVQAPANFHHDLTPEDEYDSSSLRINDTESVDSKPSMTVLSPNGGESFVLGTSFSFTWKRNNAVQMIQPVVYLNDESGKTVYGSFLDNINSTSVQSGTIPGGLVIPSTGGRFKIEVCEYPRGTNNPGYPSTPPVCDSSDNFLSINPGSTSQAPVITGVTAPTSLSVNQQGTWTVNARDPQRGPLSYSVNWGDRYRCPLYGSCPQLSDETNVFQQSASFTHSYAQAGTYTQTFTVRNNSGQEAQTTTNVKVGATSTTTSIQILSPNGGGIYQLGQQTQGQVRIPSDKKYQLSYYLIPQPGTPIRPGNGTFFDPYVGGYSAGGFFPNYTSSILNFGLAIPSDILAGSYKLRIYLRNADDNAGSPTKALAYDDSDGLLTIKDNSTYPVNLLVEASSDSNHPNKAFVIASLQGQPTNKNIYRWELSINCPNGVYVYGKNDENICHTVIVLYSSNMANPAADYSLLTAGTENLNNTSSAVTLKIVAYSQTGLKLGQDIETIKLDSAPIQSTITVYKPAAGAQLQTGSTHEIAWTGNDGGEPYSIYLVGGSLGQTGNIYLGQTTVGQKSARFFLPTTVAPGSNYQLQLSGKYATGNNSPSFSITSSVQTNSAPVITSIPAAPSSVSIGQVVNFNFTATDANNDNLGWLIEWGDGSGIGDSLPEVCPKNKEGWTFSAGHAWQKAGIYPVKVTVRDCSGASDSRTINVNVVSPVQVIPKPTASLTVNGGSSITIENGGTANLNWSSTNGATFSSTVSSVSNTGAACGVLVSSMSSPSGSQTFSGAKGGCTYTITYRVVGVMGTAESSVSIKVNSPVPVIEVPTALITANGSHNITVNVGSTIHYHWESKNGSMFSGSYTNTCAPGTVGDLPGYNNSGGDSDAYVDADLAMNRVTGQYTGCTYVITYKVVGVRGNASDSVTITVNPPASASRPSGMASGILRAISTIVSNNSNYMVGNAQWAIRGLFDQLQILNGK